jgi:hypothetical protein
MAELPKKVVEGELIKSDWVNSLLEKLGELNAKVIQLSAGIPAGTVTVPNVFGKTLFQARQILTLPSLKLTLGNVLDSNGASINAQSPGSFSLNVLGQYPVPGAKATPGSAVNLLVAGKAESAPSPPSKAPTITGFSDDKTPIGELVDIVGTNFALDKDDNDVTFKNIPAQVLTGTNLELTVRVPNIPGLPESGGNGVAVVVKVKTASGEDTANHLILPALGEGEPPSITLPLIPKTPAVNAKLTINGANFAAKAEHNIIHFDTIKVPAASSINNSQLTVIVPNNVIASPGQKAVVLMVEVATGHGLSKKSDPIEVLMQRG